MDLIFGDTAAYEEKQRIIQIEAELRENHGGDPDLEKKPYARQEESV
jgi:hypothetical protein